MEFLFELILQILVELIAQLAFELGWEGLGQSFGDRTKANPVLARWGYLLFGTILGFLLWSIFPEPFSKHEGVTILGVFLNAIGFGVLSHLYGEHRQRRGRSTTNLATFWGGVAFAFGISATRALLILI